LKNLLLLLMMMIMIMIIMWWWWWWRRGRGRRSKNCYYWISGYTQFDAARTLT
jgi:hypothetical protein